MNIFEIASRKKLTFNYRGVLQVSDLWDLTQKQLNDVYMAQMEIVAKSNTDSLLTTDTVDRNAQLRAEIVKHIFEVRKTEIEASAKRTENAARRAKLMEVLAEKQNESLKSASVEELMKMIDELSQ